jgi:hypothetical protein
MKLASPGDVITHLNHLVNGGKGDLGIIYRDADGIIHSTAFKMDEPF